MKATGTGGGAFPTTDWGLIGDIRGGGATVKLAALNILIRRYWKPVFLFLRHSGADEESAKDATQAFFADWIERDAVPKADPRRGRFRSFMLTCLKRFASNRHRAEHAGRRRPPGGIVSLDAWMDDPDMPFEPSDGMTPEAVFNRAWAVEVVRRVLDHLERECTRTGKEVHFDILARRVVQPILEGRPAPSMRGLAVEHALTEKQASNHLLTAKRAYQRLLRQEIRLYAASDAEVAEEVREIFRILGRT